jgi:hypothetical protein
MTKFDSAEIPNQDPEQKSTKCCAAGIVAWPGCHRTGGVGAHAIGLMRPNNHAPNVPRAATRISFLRAGSSTARARVSAPTNPDSVAMARLAPTRFRSLEKSRDPCKALHHVFFPNKAGLPASTLLQISRLANPGYLVEVEVIAVIPRL